MDRRRRMHVLAWRELLNECYCYASRQFVCEAHSAVDKRPTYLDARHIDTRTNLTSSSAVAERPRDALCLSVVSLNKIITRADSFIAARCYASAAYARTARKGRSPPRPLLAVPNVTAHASTASVPITALLYNGPLLCNLWRIVTFLIITPYKCSYLLTYRHYSAKTTEARL